MEVEQPPPKAVAQPPQTNNSIVSTLEARLGMYRKAVESAKAKGEAAKARRFERQLNVTILIDYQADLLDEFSSVRRLFKSSFEMPALANQ